MQRRLRQYAIAIAGALLSAAGIGGYLWLFRERDIVSVGTGFFVSRDGHIMTNRHVAAGCRGRVRWGERTGLLKVLILDPNHDLALVQTNLRPRRIAVWGQDSGVGEDVHTYGRPLRGVNNLQGQSIQVHGTQGGVMLSTLGAVSGHSGSPVANSKGHVAGILSSGGDGLGGYIVSAIAQNFLRMHGVTAAKPESAGAATASLEEIVVRIECEKEIYASLFDYSTKHCFLAPKVGRLFGVEDCTEAITSGRLGGDNLASAYIYRSAAFSDKGDYEHAVADVNEAVKLDPNFSLAYHLRGYLYNKKGDDDRAIADLAEAVTLAPKYAPAYYDRGILYAKKGDHDRAIADFTEALKFDPKDAGAYYERGRVLYEKEGGHDRAIADFTEALKLDPKNAGAYYERGRVYFDKGDFALSKADLKLGLQLQNGAFEPPDRYMLLLLSIAQSRIGEDGTAVLKAYADKVDHKTWPYAAIELLAGSRTPEATLAAASNRGERCQAHFYVGEWHVLQKHNAEAATELQTAAEKCPKNFIEYGLAKAELRLLEQATKAAVAMQK
jgi:tetratricopeptide (TPR) repeat protein